jgi:hypothetical protein
LLVTVLASPSWGITRTVTGVPTGMLVAARFTVTGFVVVLARKTSGDP